jgi:hypothetical protein
MAFTPRNELDGVSVFMLPEPLLKAAVTGGLLWRAFGNRILTRTKEVCPVSHTDTFQSGGMSQSFDTMTTTTGGRLKTSMGVKFMEGFDPRILVGSALTVGGGLNLMALNILGTDPHAIVGNPVLAFVWHGEQVFFASVNHPGTQPNPFVQKAMREVVHSMGGIIY